MQRQNALEALGCAVAYGPTMGSRRKGPATLRNVAVVELSVLFVLRDLRAIEVGVHLPGTLGELFRKPTLSYGLHGK